MVNNFKIQTWVESAQKNWGLLAQAAIWVLSIVGSFVLSPPDASTDDNKVYLGLTKFVVATFVGLMVIVAYIWHRKRDVKWWAIAALVSLVLSIGIFDRYQQLISSWTCAYAGQRKVTGTALTPQSQNHLDENPGMSCEDLIFDFAGKTEDIWTKASIDARRITLARMYLACVFLLTVCLLSVIQALYCITNTASKTPRQ